MGWLFCLEYKESRGLPAEQVVYVLVTGRGEDQFEVWLVVPLFEGQGHGSNIQGEFPGQDGES